MLLLFVTVKHVQTQKMLWLLAGVALITLGYCFAIRPYRYWVNKGVKQIMSPMFPFGDIWGLIIRTHSFAELVLTLYNSFQKSRYGGFYQFFLPTLFVKDPDLIKQITVKDFDHFRNHRNFVSEETEPLWSNNLFSLTDQKWHDMRTTLSPSFTSSKMKFIFSLISKSGKQFVNHFLRGNEELITIEMKDTFSRFANDVIANTAFGIECDSLSEPNNEFYLMGKEATDFSGFWKNLKFFVYLLFPKLSKLLVLRLFSERVTEFFNTLVKKNIESREKQGIIRPDMIHILMEARKHGVKYEEISPGVDTGYATVQEVAIDKKTAPRKMEITDADITSQALVFFFAGFDGVSSLMCFLSYELGVNPAIQERLRQEIDDTIKTCQGELTYEALLGMKYMDMVISESLRKWPNGVAIDRVCTKPYVIEPKSSDERPIYLKKDDVVWIPIIGFHRDPKNFPDPDKFDPERFNDKNRGEIKPYTYMPFGSGPRNRIGSRFALLETKTIFFYIL